MGFKECLVKKLWDIKENGFKNWNDIHKVYVDSYHKITGILSVVYYIFHFDMFRVLSFRDCVHSCDLRAFLWENDCLELSNYVNLISLTFVTKCIIVDISLAICYSATIKPTFSGHIQN